MASQFYCQECGDPVEPHQPRPYGRKIQGLSVHVGENYLMNQKFSGLEPEDREQLKKWSHAVVVVDGNGNVMRGPSDNLNHRQFRW